MRQQRRTGDKLQQLVALVLRKIVDDAPKRDNDLRPRVKSQIPRVSFPICDVDSSRGATDEPLDLKGIKCAKHVMRDHVVPKTIARERERQT